MSEPFPSLISADPQLGLTGDVPVHTADGLRPLAQLRPGDLVLTHLLRPPPPSRRRGEGEWLYRAVSRIDSREAMEAVQLTVRNLADGLEDTLTLALDQPVWTHPGGWRRAVDLEPMQAVVLSFNGNALIHDVKRVAGPVQLRRLEVAEGHSYYPGRLGTWVADQADLAEPVMVSPRPRIDFSKPQTLVNIPNYYNDHFQIARQAPARNPVAEAAAGAPHVSPQAADPDMRQILEKLRQQVKLRQQRMNPISLASLLVKRPDKVPPQHGLARLWDDQERLLTEGQVGWAALVQANSLLFQPGPKDCPGQVVHSHDTYFDDRPAELRQIGRFVFSLKQERPADPALRALAESIAGEADYSMSVPLPAGISLRPVLGSTLMLFRKHLPNGVLGGGLFPLLHHPSTKAVMMVPFEFWPIELIVRWKEQSL